MTVTLFALFSFSLVWAFHFFLLHAIKMSIEVEEEKLTEAQIPRDLEHLKILGVLRSLEIVLMTIFTAFLPIAGLVLGSILPDPLRGMLAEAVGPVTIIAIAIAVLFAYYAVFKIWRRHLGERVRKRLRDMLFRDGPSGASGG